MTPETLQTIAFTCAASMKEVVGPEYSNNTRRTTFDYAKEHLAHALAEYETGISRLDVKFIRLKGSKTVTTEDPGRTNKYTDALAEEYRVFNRMTYEQFLARCEEISRGKI